jgi:hypothetical protein
MYGPLNDPYFILLVLSCAAVMTIGSLVTALNRIPRAGFARSQNELNELSGRVSALEAAEQRRCKGAQFLQRRWRSQIHHQWEWWT